MKKEPEETVVMRRMLRTLRSMNQNSACRVLDYVNAKFYEEIGVKQVQIEELISESQPKPIN